MHVARMCLVIKKHDGGLGVNEDRRPSVKLLHPHYVLQKEYALGIMHVHASPPTHAAKRLEMDRKCKF